MKSVSKKLFAFDLDGTLVHSLKSDHSERGIPDYLRTTVERLAQKFSIVVATGRRYRAAKMDIDVLPKMPFHIVHNGLVIKTGEGKTIRAHTISREVGLKTAEIMESLGYHPFLVSDGFDHETDYSFTKRGFDESPYLRYIQQRPRQTSVVLGELDEISLPLLEVATLGTYEELLALKAQLEPKLDPNLKIVIVRNIGVAAHLSAMEIFDAQVSKWTAVKFVAEKLGISEVISVGDDGNDKEMIEFAHTGVAMGHADEEIRKLARVVVEGPEGLRDFLEGYFENEES